MILGITLLEVHSQILQLILHMFVKTLELRLYSLFFYVVHLLEGVALRVTVLQFVFIP